jgi:hypothetical protein
MTTIRLIREVTEPSGRGPGNGQYALQRALRERAPKWLKIGGKLADDDIPWVWCWLDMQLALRCEQDDRLFIIGPNVLFNDSYWPGRAPGERLLCDARHCALMFTESAWYCDLIEGQRGPNNRAEIVVWPYPIEPRPGGPLSPWYDLLIYAKGQDWCGLTQQLASAFPNSCQITYGKYQRDDLIKLARRSRCCAYLSEDDRGPLALAEILLCGCPAIGVPTGAPFVEPGENGVLLRRFHPPAIIEAVAACHAIDRRTVSKLATVKFDAGRIVGIILSALRKLAE